MNYVNGITFLSTSLGSLLLQRSKALGHELAEVCKNLNLTFGA